ncbi:MAG: mechanosensitive ion channel [Nitrososphaerota archaeon]|jgi:small-conductance mechanosensitive channel|nr:mechanosensitive ion channel [Nitrososphaerota archaeon]
MSTAEPTSATQAGSFFGLSINQIILLMFIVIIAIVLERFITRYLSRFSKQAKLDPNTANKLTLTFRILILIVALLAISKAGGLPSDLLLSVSAISGAALGFASQKTIGNFIAGLYLLAARPFKVGDYIKIGTVEGIAQEITLNYAKVLTAGNNIVAVSNLQMLDRDITNYLYQTTLKGNIYCYTFEIGFDHLVPTEKLLEIFDTIFDTYKHLPKRPFCTLTRSTAIERVYTVYFYVTETRDIFTTRPQIANQVFKRWDEERTKLKTTNK